MDIIEHLESEVRSYCRGWPATFAKASGWTLWDEEGNEYLDFFAGAGSLNYGHNDPKMRDALVDYLMSDGIVHGLDKITTAKKRFLERFEEVVLKPRGLDHKVMFPGPTGTNAVESALKLARKVTGRERAIGFTNAFHGMTLGSLSVTGNSMKREGAGLLLSSAVSMPYDGYMGDDTDTIEYLHQMLDDDGSGLDLPAAVIVETVQAEGGLSTASIEWLQRLEELCRNHDTLLIVDDIQAGCGRTGPFFSFERAGIEPDMVTLSKSLSGFGLPFAITTFKRELDVWDPGEHNGTFRGNNAAFVTATEALRFWQDDELTKEVDAKAATVSAKLQEIVDKYPDLGGEVRGRGLVQGIACADPSIVPHITREAFERRLLIETSGPESEVVKLLPPLVIDHGALEHGLEIIDESVAAALGTREPATAAG